MTTSQTQLESQTIELSAEAFNTFCGDISSTFEVGMNCSRQESCTETVEGFKKRFKKLAAVNSVKAEGTLDGTFLLVFDREGLFTLGGVIVMLPEQKILDNRKHGSAQDTQYIIDAVGEAGNMLVDSLDRVFRNGLPGHNHFVKTNTPMCQPDRPAG